MSYLDKGSMPTTVLITRDPDRGGNFTCSGVNDEVEVLAAFIYMDILGGGHLHIGIGSYVFGSQLSVPYSNILLTGDGTNTVITFSGVGYTFKFTSSTTIENITIRDIKFVGEPTEGNNQILGLFNVTYFTVKNCHFMNSGDEAISVGINTGSSRYGQILNNMFVDCPSTDTSGGTITIQTGTHMIKNNIIIGGVGFAIHLEAIADTELIRDTEIIGNKIYGESTVRRGIYLNAESYGIRGIEIVNNEVDDTLIGAIMDGTSGTENVADILINGNTIEGGGGTDAAARGAINIIKNSPENIIITDNIIKTWDVANANKFAIQVVGSEFNVNDNNINGTGDSGIKVNADRSTVQGNIVEDAGQAGSGNRAGVELIADDIVCTNNILEGCRTAIRVLAGATNNVVKYNKITNNVLAALFIDAGTNTQFETYSMQFIDGTTLISAAGNPWGFEIDSDAEYAITWGWLPYGLQQIVQIRVIGVGLAAPGAGNAMRLELTGEGATFDEVYTTRSIDIANKNSEETNFGVNDVIQWIFVVANDAQIGTILGGDRVQFKVLHEAAGNGDIATDATVSSVEIEYV